MLICRHDLSLSIRVLVGVALIRHKILHPIAWNRLQGYCSFRVTEEGNRIPRRRARFAFHSARLVFRWEDHPVNGTSKQPVGPVREQVSNIDQNWGADVVLRTRRADGHRSPSAIFLLEFQAGLAFEPEEQRDGAVIRVCACADVIVAGARSLVRWWVAEKTQDGGGFAVCAVGCGEEVANLIGMRFSSMQLRYFDE